MRCVETWSSGALAAAKLEAFNVFVSNWFAVKEHGAPLSDKKCLFISFRGMFPHNRMSTVMVGEKESCRRLFMINGRFVFCRPCKFASIPVGEELAKLNGLLRKDGNGRL